MEKSKILLKGHIVSKNGISEKSVIEISNGVITYVGETGTFFPGAEHLVCDFGSSYICPGFIDMHVHGAGGADVMDGTYQSLDWISEVLAEGGTTAFLATTMSAPKSELEKVIKNINSTRLRGTTGAKVVGVHLEGPFLNPAKKGAHMEEHLKLPDVKQLADYIDIGKGSVKMITLAPELEGALEVIQYAKSRGVVVSLGHSDSSIASVNEAIKAGLSHVTHAFNAMSGMHHRDPGTTGAILSMKDLSADVIPDGVHVHPAVIKILAHSKGLDKVCIITDCMRAGGMGDGSFEMGGQRVSVKKGVAYLDDGTIAGSTISMANGIKNMAGQVGLPLPEAICLASTNPARILGLESKGLIEKGKDADIVILDRSFRVLMTIVEGEIVYNPGESK